MSADIGSLIEHLDLPSVGLVGHSFGGSIGALVGARMTDRIPAIMMVDSTLLPSGQASIRSRAASGPRTFLRWTILRSMRRN